MKYDLESVSKFGNSIKELLSQRAFDMINKYKQSSAASAFDKKVEQNDSDKQTD